MRAVLPGYHRLNIWYGDYKESKRKKMCVKSVWDSVMVCVLKYLLLEDGETVWCLTLITEEFKRHFTLRRLIKVPIVQHFVIQWESAEPKLLYRTEREHNAQLIINSSRGPWAVKGKVIVLTVYVPCRRRFPSLRKQLPSHSRLSRCCLMSSKISGWILSRSSLQHKHSLSNRVKHASTHLCTILHYLLLRGQSWVQIWEPSSNVVCC